MQTFIHQKARRGVTLIEAVLFISIALGLIVGGLVFFQQASLAARTNDAVRSLSSLASETRAAYRTSQTFAGLTETVLINAGAVPSNQVRANTGADANDVPNIIVNEWNNRVTIAPSAQNVPAANTAAGTFFEITYTDIPVAACTRLATATDGNGPIGPGIVAIRATGSQQNATAVYAQGGNPVGNVVSPNGTADITPAAAATMCNQTAPIDVTFTLTR